MPLALLALACLQRDTFPDLSRKDTGAVDTAVPPADTATGDTGPATPGTVTVSHRREMRGIFVTSVWNIDWPARTGLSANQLTQSVGEMVDTLADAGINAIFLQVRPESDALYASSIEPWSRWISESQGTNPGMDPLAVWVEAAHARGLELHAWMNPYRARAGSTSTSSLAANHIARQHPEHAHAYPNETSPSRHLWMDPGADVVRQRVLDVIADVVTRYDVDGVVFDDYFYPYPVDGVDFPDTATWNAYRNAGGSLARDDWRRDNVNRLVRGVHETIAAIRPSVRFGVSPFGIWRPGNPAGVTGLDAYDAIYCDPPTWAAQGWVDYLAPQLYWRTTSSGQPYGALTRWWDGQLSEGQWLFPANALYRLEDSSPWPVSEFTDEIAITRDTTLTRTGGHVWYPANTLVDDVAGVRALARGTWYAAPAVPPPVAAVATRSVTPPVLTRNGATVSWTVDADVRAVLVYAERGGAWTLDRVVPQPERTTSLATGRWALSALAAGDVESEGVPVEVP
ncbi:MAG: hypothetical protein RLZZ299_545 [Pseudomonadota bacterium]|jgi:uncharacterized lipoprotein YddW (UPF0748 family)